MCSISITPYFSLLILISYIHFLYAFAMKFGKEEFEENDSQFILALRSKCFAYYSYGGYDMCINIVFKVDVYCIE